MFKRPPFSAGFRIGYVGGGQLAAMSALQAFRFGMDVAVYAASADEPLCRMTPHATIGRMDDEAALAAFFRTCDVVTLENEFLDADLLLRARNAAGTPLFPTPETFARIADKIVEKRTFAAAGIPVAPWAEIAGPADLDAFGAAHGWPYVLKSAKGGYDGYGNATVTDAGAAREAWRRLGGADGRPVLAEAFVPFSLELAVMVARNLHGTAVYPCVQSIQAGHICKEILAPAPVPPALRRQAQELAVAAMEAVDATGIFGFEFFLTTDGRILLNESAPRPHNSGHYTMEACMASQFENHVRAVCQLPLGDPSMRRPAAAMINLLGTDNRPTRFEHTAETLDTSDAHLHLYGKTGSRIGRKMGHLTLLGEDPAETLALARQLTDPIRT